MPTKHYIAVKVVKKNKTQSCFSYYFKKIANFNVFTYLLKVQSVTCCPAIG